MNIWRCYFRTSMLLRKKKEATIETRKNNSFEYSCVCYTKNMLIITCMCMTVLQSRLHKLSSDRTKELQDQDKTKTFYRCTFFCFTNI